MASVGTASSVSMSRIMRLLDHNSILLTSTSHEKRQQARNEEEDAVHDPERKRCLQHRADLVRLNIEAVQGDRSQAAGNGPGFGLCARTICACNEAELVDTCDECADETEVNEGDEESVGACAVVREQRCDGPGGAQDGDDEKNEDIVG